MSDSHLRQLSDSVRQSDSLSDSSDSSDSQGSAGDVDCVRLRIRTCVNSGWVSADFCGMQDTSLLLYSGYAYLLPSCLRIRLRIQAVSMRHSGLKVQAAEEELLELQVET